MARLETLNSWKEIADYLHRSVRTVQRWEQRFNLPVRHRAGKRTSVFALEAELNSWLQTRSRFRGTAPPAGSLYETVFECTPVPLALVNDLRECVNVNQAMRDLLSRSRHETRNLRLDAVVIENERGSLSAAWEMMLSGGSVSNSLLLSKQGEMPRWVEFQGIARVLPGLHLVMFTSPRDTLVPTGVRHGRLLQTGTGK